MQFISCASAIDVKLMRKTIKRLGEFGMKHFGTPRMYWDWTSYFHDNDRVLQIWRPLDNMKELQGIDDNLVNSKDAVDQKILKNEDFARERVGLINIKDIATYTAKNAKPPGFWDAMQVSFQEYTSEVMVQSIDCSNIDQSGLEGSSQLTNHSYMDCVQMVHDLSQLCIHKKRLPYRRSQIKYVYSLE